MPRGIRGVCTFAMRVAMMKADVLRMTIMYRRKLLQRRNGEKNGDVTATQPRCNHLRE